MRAVAVYTLACSVLAMASAGAIAVPTYWWGRPVLAGWALMWTAAARAGVQQIEVATRPARRRP